MATMAWGMSNNSALAFTNQFTKCYWDRVTKAVIWPISPVASTLPFGQKTKLTCCHVNRTIKACGIAGMTWMKEMTPSQYCICGVPVAICVAALLLQAVLVLLHHLSKIGCVQTSRVTPSCVDPASDLWTAHLSVWKANSELLHQDRQDLVDGRASLAGYQSGKVACLARCISVYFQWLWLTVSHGYQTHKRPMRFWLANYHGGDGGGKNEENNKSKQEMEEGKRGYRGLHEDAKPSLLLCKRLCNLGCLLPVCLSGLRLTRLLQLWALSAMVSARIWCLLRQTAQWPCQNCCSVYNR